VFIAWRPAVAEESLQEPEALVEAARRGDGPAQRTIHDLIRSFARHICRKTSASGLQDLDWEDVAQEAGRRFFSTGVERFRPGGEFKAYVYKYVLTTHLHLSRTAYRRKLRELKAEPPRPGFPNPEMTTTLHLILSKLSSECHLLLQRLYYDGVTYTQLALDLAMAESSVRSKTSRCLRRAREIAKRRG
jgi:RNA polymerase sigma factor (sigma-70 family)